MNKDTSTFPDNQPRKIVHGTYLSHFDYIQMGRDFVSDEKMKQAVKVECEKTVFTAYLHEEKNS